MDGKHKDEYHVKDIRSDQGDINRKSRRVKRASDCGDSVIVLKRLECVSLSQAGPPSGSPRRSSQCSGKALIGQTDGVLLEAKEFKETSMIPMDIDPKADRLVFFWSDRRNPHEVMPVFRPRFAVTIWYMDREERRKAIEKQAQEAEESEAKQTNERSAATPPPIQRLGKDHMQMFPSASSEPSLANMEQSDRGFEYRIDYVVVPDGSNKVPAGRDAGASRGVVVSAPHAIRNTTVLRASSMNSVSDEDEEPPQPPTTTAPADYEI
ncbi:hypothetical protein TELCIR_08493 [Teladorsagia circumcincta]|uniref:Prolyl 4-hydroxylase alpha subunit Fe(2+) 2OG dioxygenase domain-containing protein n=1 Tax=Teladorsagia circumcincta TaxID=45464 RepID=A0A2G9UHL9_TELCI|nr:hypothetical protein TELCIR_08493 [Teladorsagia circumcincta]